ncbi:MAG: hypothetical protein IJN66_01045 [Muribaculaceae bacterium]|nr:hypothetical protein [Muribaculaceae bacterium]
MSLFVTLTISLLVACFFSVLQIRYFKDTAKYRSLFQNFFKKVKPYAIAKQVNWGMEQDLSDTNEVIRLELVGTENSDLNNLISEINNYIEKTKGTTDFSVIQSKVERKLNMRYDQSTATLAFPTYLGLMGTFAGVFMGILAFVVGFDGAGNITDSSIQDLLIGVLVSMFTSLLGLILTTINNANAGAARKQIEEDKNEFYDFIQTELMPTIDVSMVVAITKLHETVDKFEPAFDRVINRFQTTFDNCTRAFGDNFERNVVAVAGAVDVMGQNMDKINQNIRLQENLLATLKSGDLIKGMDKYIEAANHFVGITQSLNKFEEARRMMLAATQETISMQKQFADSLTVPREIAVKINQVLERIKTFEENINHLGEDLSRREILGNDVVNAIQSQVNAIAKKGKIADKYLGVADGKLEDLFTRQTEVIDSMSNRYASALDKHLREFENILEENQREIISRRDRFLTAIEDKLSIEEVHKDFSNLKKLNEIERKLSELASVSVSADKLHSDVKALQTELAKINESLNALNEKESAKSGWTNIFGRK